MKTVRFFALFMCFCAIFTLSGCGEKELPSAKITRDDQRTGGSYSFVYDSHLRTITVGGEGEVVQFSQADVTKGLEEGTRIGLKVTAPDESLDLSNATLEMNGVHYSSDDFLEVINGQKQRFFTLQPLVSKDDKEIKFVVCWAEGTKEQEYKIIVADGTKFMTKDGKLLEDDQKSK